MDNNLSGGYISNDNTLSGIIDINANSVTAETITGIDGYFTNLNVQNLQIVGGDGSLGIASWGSFWSLATQTNASTSAVNTMTYNNYDICNNKVNIKSGSSSQIQVDLSGVYNIQFSAQTNITQGSNGTIYIWLRVNGVNIASTNGKENIGNANGQIIAWNYILPLNALDYVELVWSSTDIHCQLLYEAASGSPTKPAVPSVILTVQAVSTNIKGDKGDQGIQGEKGNQGNTGGAGTNATVTVGSTITTAAGTQANVSNSGTASAAIFDFQIPQGAKGDKGERGERGEKGSQAESTLEAEAAAVAAGISATAAAASAAQAATAGAIAGAEAGAEAGAAAAEAVIADLEPRLVVVEGKTAYQSAFLDGSSNKHTEFDGIVEINTNDGFQRVTIDGTSAGKISVGTSSAFQTEIQPSSVRTQTVYSALVDSQDNASAINIGNTATKVVIGNNATMENNVLNIKQTGSSGTQVSTLGVITQSLNANYIDVPNSLDSMYIGQTASIINIGNQITASVGVPQINLYGKVYFDPTELVGVVYQFFN
jgi:hypothetical protein